MDCRLWIVAGTFLIVGCAGNQGLTPAPIYRPDRLSRDWHEIPAPSYIADLQFQDASNGVAVGGGIHWTEDGGETWMRSQAPEAEGLNSISYRSATEVYVAGGDHNPEEVFPQKVLKSRDGGRTWSEYPVPNPHPVFLFKTIHWVTPKRGYILWNHLLATDDGGAHWRLMPWPGEPMSSVRFADERAAWFVSGTQVYRSRDGGTTWGEAANLASLLLWQDDEWLRKIRNSGSSHLWAFGARGTVLGSQDAGTSWRILTRFPSKQEVKDAWFIDSQRGWVILYRQSSDHSEIIRTDDGGIHWERDYWVNGKLERLCFVGDRFGWAAGKRLVKYKAPAKPHIDRRRPVLQSRIENRESEA